MSRVQNGALAHALGLLIASCVPALARCERSHFPWRYGESVSGVWHTDGAHVSITVIVE